MSPDKIKFKATLDSLFTDSVGNVYIYLTDSVIEDNEKGIYEWANAVGTNLGSGAEEHNLAIKLDLPQMAAGLVEYFDESAVAGKRQVPMESKPKLDCFRAQLLGALAELDKVTYV